MRKLVQNGMTSSRMNRPLWRPARVARKYASGRAMSRVRAVPSAAICRLSMNGSTPLSDLAVVVQLEGRGVAAVLRLLAEAEDDDEGHRQHQEQEVPEARGSEQERGQKAGAGPAFWLACLDGRRRRGHRVASRRGLAAEARLELGPDGEPVGVVRGGRIGAFEVRHRRLRAGRWPGRPASPAGRASWPPGSASRSRSSWSRGPVPSGRWMKSNQAYVAFGWGASAIMTHTSIQKSVPSLGTTYFVSAVSGFARSSTSGPVQPRQRTASSEASLSWYVSESSARMCGARSSSSFLASLELRFGSVELSE